MHGIWVWLLQESGQQAGSNLNPLRDHFCTICTVGEVMIKTPNICFALWVFYHLGSLGIYFDTMDPKFKKNDQKCSIGGADGNFTGFCY